MSPANRPRVPNIVQLRCNGCGASLRLPPRAAFVSCEYCGASLQIRREGGAAFTVVLAAVEKVGRTVSVIELQNRLERLDREWSMREAELMTAGEHGTRERPSRARSLAAGALVAVFGTVWTGAALTNGAPAMFPLFGVICIGFGLWRALAEFGKAGTYDTERRAYERRRSELANAISRAQS